MATRQVFGDRLENAREEVTDYLAKAKVREHHRFEYLVNRGFVLSDFSTEDS